MRVPQLLKMKEKKTTMTTRELVKTTEMMTKLKHREVGVSRQRDLRSVLTVPFQGFTVTVTAIILVGVVNVLKYMRNSKQQFVFIMRRESVDSPATIYIYVHNAMIIKRKFKVVLKQTDLKLFVNLCRDTNTVDVV